MKKVFYLYITLFVTLSFKNGRAQIYSTDPAYILDTLRSDEFDRSYLKSWKWYSGNNYYGHGNEKMYSSSIITQGDSLSIKAQDLSPNEIANGKVYKYTSGEIGSVNLAKYGYFEMSARYPIGNMKFWPCLWLWRDSCNSTYPSDPTKTWYNELDIFETSWAGSFFGHKSQTNYYCSDTAKIATLTSCPNDLGPYNAQGIADVDLSPASLGAFHKYAALWTPDSVCFYFDDNVVRTVKTYIPKHSMVIIIDFYVNYFPTVIGLGMNGLDVLGYPRYFTLQYFRYYKLNTDCSTDKTICNPSTDYYNAAKPRAVEKTITAGGVSCTPTFNTSDQCTLRATDYVILDAGTTINNDGSGYFSVSIEKCPQ